MPHNGVSAFHYPRCLDQEPGSIWSCTLEDGCDYEQHWAAALYGGYVEMPLNYLKQVETMSFERIGTCKERPIGDQMRQLYRGVDWSYLFLFRMLGKTKKKVRAYLLLYQMLRSSIENHSYIIFFIQAFYYLLTCEFVCNTSCFSLFHLIVFVKMQKRFFYCFSFLFQGGVRGEGGGT